MTQMFSSKIRKAEEGMASGIFHEIYLDNSATTQPLPEVREIMLKALGHYFGNPSSAHAAGDRARDYIYHAREAVANLIGADPDKLIFTSGGTEANNMVLASVLRGHGSTPRVLTTEVEHSSILKYCEYLSDFGVEVHY